MGNVAVDNVHVIVIALALGSQQGKGVGRWWAKRETRKSLHMFMGMQRV
jgi:hypothetical protein